MTIDEVLEEVVSVKAFPNPFKQQTTIQVEGKVYESLEIEIYDVMGRLVHTQQAIGTQSLQLERGNLLSGIYVYRLSGGRELINIGKIIAQ